jgi:hypothetical protein
VIASRHDLPELERELDGMAAAGSRPTGSVTRGVSGLSPAPLSGGTELEALAEQITSELTDDGLVWVRWLVLFNP